MTNLITTYVRDTLLFQHIVHDWHIPLVGHLYDGLRAPWTPSISPNIICLYYHCTSRSIVVRRLDAKDVFL